MFFKSKKKFISVAREAYENSVEKGFWNNHPTIFNLLDLIKDELNELNDASSKVMSKVIPEFTEKEEEAADVVILSLGSIYGNGKRRGLVNIRGIQGFSDSLLMNPDVFIILEWIKDSYSDRDRSEASYWWFIFLNKIAKMIGKDRLEEAIEAKMAYNKTRPYLHGKFSNMSEQESLLELLGQVWDEYYHKIKGRHEWDKVSEETKREWLDVFGLLLSKIELKTKND